MKAIGYVRVSTEEQAREGISLDHQQAKIIAYAQLHGMDLYHASGITGEILADEGVSAKSLDKRWGAQEVLRLARAGDIGAIIVYKLDRLFRNAREALEVATELNSLGVALHSVTERLDTQSAMGKFFFTIMAACAEMERNLISERTRDALRHKRAKGEVYNHIPYGYREDGGKLVKDPAEIVTIDFMRSLRQAGHTYQMIADSLNVRGVPTKRMGKGGKIAGKVGTWQPQTVKNILNRAPIGEGL